MAPFGEWREGAVVHAELTRPGPSALWGGAAEVGSPDATSLRLALLRAPPTSFRVRALAEQGSSREARTSALILSMGVVLRPVPTLLVAQPFFVVGGGVHFRAFHGFQQPGPDPGSSLELPAGTADRALDLAAGLELHPAGRPVRAEVGLLFSSFRPRVDLAGKERPSDASPSSAPAGASSGSDPERKPPVSGPRMRQTALRFTLSLPLTLRRAGRKPHLSRGPHRPSPDSSPVSLADPSTRGA